MENYDKNKGSSFLIIGMWINYIYGQCHKIYLQMILSELNLKFMKKRKQKMTLKRFFQVDK